MIMTASLAMVTAWSYYCPLIRQFRPNTSYKHFGRPEVMASIFESQKHRLDDWIKPIESSKHHCRHSSRSSEISVRACTPAFGLLGIRMVIIGIRLQTWMRVIVGEDV